MAHLGGPTLSDLRSTAGQLSAGPGGRRRAAPPASRSKAPTAPPNVSAIGDKALRQGDAVFVARRLWPDEPCDEHAGQGWAATVVRSTSETAVVSFTYARDEDGNLFANERLKVSSLLRLLPAEGKQPRTQAFRRTWSRLRSLTGRGEVKKLAAPSQSTATAIVVAPAVASPTAPPTAPPTLSAIGDEALRQGDAVFVARRLWPDEPCDEHAGLGWAATVVHAESETAVVSFTYARDEDGEQFEDESINVRSLQRLHTVVEPPAGRPTAAAVAPGGGILPPPPLPRGWHALLSRDGAFYFFANDVEPSHSQWEVPKAALAVERDLPTGWTAQRAGDGKRFYYWCACDKSSNQPPCLRTMPLHLHAPPLASAGVPHPNSRSGRCRNPHARCTARCRAAGARTSRTTRSTFTTFAPPTARRSGRCPRALRSRRSGAVPPPTRR